MKGMRTISDVPTTFDGDYEPVTIEGVVSVNTKRAKTTVQTEISAVGPFLKESVDTDCYRSLYWESQQQVLDKTYHVLSKDTFEANGNESIELLNMNDLMNEKWRIQGQNEDLLPCRGSGI